MTQDQPKRKGGKKCECGMNMANYAWTKECRLCHQGRRKPKTQQNNTSEILKKLHDPKLMSEIIQATNEAQRKIVEKASEREGKNACAFLLIIIAIGIISIINYLMTGNL